MDKNKTSKECCMRVQGELVDYQIWAKNFEAFYSLQKIMQEINIHYWLVKWALMRQNN